MRRLIAIALGLLLAHGAAAQSVTSQGLPLSGGAVNGNVAITGTTTIGNGSANYLTAVGATTTNYPTFTALGSDTDVGFQFMPKGKGIFRGRRFDLGDSAFSMGVFDGSSTLALHSNPTYTTTATPGFYSQTDMAGSVTSGNAFVNSFIVNTDTVNTTTGSGPGGTTALYIGSGPSGAGVTGNRTSLGTLMNVKATTGNSGTGGTYYYTSAGFGAISAVNDGGTGGTPYGNLFAVNPSAHLLTGATFWNSIVGGEVDIGVQTGASVAHKEGVKVTLLSDDAVHGTSEFGFGIGQQNGGTPVGLNNGFVFSTGDGWWPMSANSTLIGTLPAGVGGGPAFQAAYGMDLSAVTFSSGFLKSNGFLVDGSGNVTAPSIGNGASAFKISGSGQWSANGAVATTMTGVGPTGSHTTVQEWLTVTDSAGIVRYIPAY